MHEDETSLVGAAVEHADVLDVALDRHAGRGEHVVVVVLNHIRLRVVDELPVVKSVSICVFEQWLAIVNFFSTMD